MALRYGKCTNFGLCTKADTKANQTIPEGSDFVCEECKRPLTATGTSGPAGSRPSFPIWLIAVVLFLIGGSCWVFTHRGKRESGAAAGAAPSGNAAVLLRLSGSNTIGSQLAPDLVERWLASKGASDIHRSGGSDETAVTATLNGSPISVQVKAHGSATAFTDLGSNSCDIGMASRKIKSQETSDLQSKGLGDLTSNANERVLGLDGVAVIANEGNEIDSLSADEVANIFSGASSKQSWNVYARDDKSGTYDTFKDRVLGNRSLASSAKRFEDSRELVSAVAKDRNGIGFVGLPYAVGVKVLAVFDKGATPLVPNTMTVRTEAYPLSRRLYFYLPGNAKPEARDFVRFALSPQGQDVVEKNGFVGQKVDVVKEQAPANAPKGYVDLMPSADRLSVDFRFRTGSSELDSKAVDDVKRVAAAMSSQYSGRGVMLVGFADSTGNRSANLKLSKDRAQSVAAQMERQGVTTVSVTGFGQDLPVADNATPEGREKNRRVEIWLRK
jgi:phosphate transport system substrate-binding protein